MGIHWDRNLGSLMYLSPMPRIIPGTQQVFGEYLRNEQMHSCKIKYVFTI